MATLNQDQNAYITYGQMNLINNFRALWTDLIVWLRSYMVSTFAGFGNINAISNRLYRIPGDFNAALRPFIGVDSAEKFQQILLMFIVHAQTMITAQKNKNQKVADEAATAIYADADTMAYFLASINPYWNKGQWQNIFYQLNGMGITEAVALLSGDYDKEIDILDRMMKHALLQGDYMASGVMHYLVPEIPLSPQQIKNMFRDLNCAI